MTKLDYPSNLLNREAKVYKVYCTKNKFFYTYRAKIFKIKES